MNNTLALNAVTYWYEQPDKAKNFIVRDISVTFAQGTSYALVGPSGSGKSTVIHLLIGLLEPQEGQVQYNEQPITNLKRDVWLATEMGIMLQQPLLLHEYSVIENVMLKHILTGCTNQVSYDQASYLLAKLGMYGMEYKKAWQLSIGQQQRVAAARALFGFPAFILADEPTAALDKEAAKDLIELMCDTCKLQKTGMIIATHDEMVNNAIHSIVRLENCHLTVTNKHL